MTTFSIGETDFLRDGEPHRVLSGAIHYFRVHPDHWADRIRKARLMGLNTVETYVAWNAHEPRHGEWDTTGANDLGRFLDLIAAEGMDAIVRPGPYICAEWHNGGLPVWLTRDERIRLRSSDPAFLAEIETYLRRVSEIVVPRQIDRGGPVVLVQIENEYGAYGDDAAYLRALVRITRDSGITVPLTTVDQPQHQMLRDGSLPGLHRTGSFGSQAARRLKTLRAHQETGPLMCSEFWDGWFDWWGGVHHTTSAEDAAAELDTLLSAGASVNIYMFHGGTNFGLTNGANHKGRYLPITTSYDYDAPLDEAGDPTAKFHAFRAVIAKHAPVPAGELSAAPPRPAATASLVARGPWVVPPAAGTVHTDPPTFEALDTLAPLVCYQTTLPGTDRTVADPSRAATDATWLLAFGEVRDAALVSVDGVVVGRISRTAAQNSLRIPAGGRTLTVLVEEQGRVNYDHRLGERKGLIGAATLDGAPLQHWRAAPVDPAAALTALDAATATGQDPTGPTGPGAMAGPTGPGAVAGPGAWRAEVWLDAASDLFLDTNGWGDGFAFVNGFLLGRYRRTGPQRTLFVPAPVTRAGANIVDVLELTHLDDPTVRFVPEPLLGPLEE
ncbi:beta-galactosidase family protein [Microbacterium panaciterrae]|uniref:Beta-galactosidase n=1 Tax=Microbacterium panaciterrae TaxID=985759 RepID=A0ABP8P5M4_9MICO